jgi:hypothetical protein
MRRESNGTLLSAVFVDYDNIYLSLRRKSEEAAKRFSKDAALWLKELETGRLITPTNAPAGDLKRRMVMNRCYGNPVPRRSGHDNSTDMNSFPFVRHHFLRGGFEVIDCPPLTAQLKNSSDIRIVMDVRDFLTHETYFDEFIILSGDADFTPVLHRLRAHARRTVIFANDYTATPYTAICDGEVRESDLIRLLVDGQLEVNGLPALAANSDLVAARSEIIAEVVAQVRNSAQPMPLEVLAERAVRVLGHERTAGSSWAGAGSFRELLVDGLPADIRITDEPPYLAFNAEAKPQPALTREPRSEPAPIQRREAAPPRAAAAASQVETRQAPPAAAPAPRAPAGNAYLAPQANAMPPRSRVPLLETQPAVPLNDTQPEYDAPLQPTARAAAAPAMPVSNQSGPSPRATYANVPVQAPAPQQSMPAPAPAPTQTQPPARAAAPAPAPKVQSRAATSATSLQQSVTRIYEACQAPPLSPPDYRRLFEAMAAEITENGLQGSQTLANIQARTMAAGLQIQRDDVRFVLDVVSEPDPWFEQGASANLFAGRFRNFVVARCRGQGLNLSVEELDLIEAWFTGGPEMMARPAEPRREAAPAPAPQRAAPSTEGWWQQDAGRGEPDANNGPGTDDEFPRIVRSRLRG